MSGQVVEPVVTEREVLAWWTEIDLCHICADGPVKLALCGAGGWPEFTCPDYDGEAICPGCGLPTCPRCAQLEAIEYALEAE